MIPASELARELSRCEQSGRRMDTLVASVDQFAVEGCPLERGRSHGELWLGSIGRILAYHGYDRVS